MISTDNLIAELAAALDTPEKLVAHYAKRLRTAGLLPPKADPLTTVQALHLLLATALEGPAEATAKMVSLLASLKFKGTQLAPLVPWQASFVAADHPASGLRPTHRLIDILYAVATSRACAINTTAQLVTIGSDGRTGYAVVDLHFRDEEGTPDASRLLFGQHPCNTPAPVHPVRTVQFGGHVLTALGNLLAPPELEAEDNLRCAHERGAAFWHPAPAMIS